MQKTIKTDVLIMGAGIAGLCTASALAEKGLKVVVVGRKALAGEASTRAAGIIDPYLGHTKVSPLLSLALEAFRYFPAYVRRLERASGIDVEFRKTGMVYVAMTKGEARILEKTYEWQKKLTVPVKWLDKKNLHRKFPFISAGAESGLFYPTLGKINPELFIQACEKYAQQKGIIILKLKNETKISENEGGYTTSSSKVRVNAPRAVIATGSWSSRISRFKKFLPVKPVRGQIFVGKSRLRIPAVVHAVHDAYLVPRESGDYLLGSTVEFAGYNAATTQDAKKKILKRMTSIIPALEGMRISDAWAGLRPWSSDLKPVIGRIPGTSLYAATGYFRSGLLLGPYCGSLLADLIGGMKLSSLTRHFTPGRFTK